MATEKIFIIDESTNQVKPDYDLLKDASVNPEDLIEIKEKKLPGRRRRSTSMRTRKRRRYL